MELVTTINRTKYEVFRWRYELALSKKLALALGMACVIGAVAQLRIILPFSPVPITGQTFAVLLTAIFLGRRWGGISVAIYAGLGAAGVPWFAPQAGMPIFSAGGWGHLAGPTGGYIIGFIFAALFLGHFIDTYIKSRNFLSMLALMLFANFILIYVPGLLQLGLWLNLVKGEPVAFTTLLSMGAIPFIVGDIIKIALAASIARGITPKLAYNGESDKGKR